MLRTLSQPDRRRPRARSARRGAGIPTFRRRSTPPRSATRFSFAPARPSSASSAAREVGQRRHRDTQRRRRQRSPSHRAAARALDARREHAAVAAGPHHRQGRRPTRPRRSSVQESLAPMATFSASSTSTDGVSQLGAGEGHPARRGRDRRSALRHHPGSRLHHRAIATRDRSAASRSTGGRI